MRRIFIYIGIVTVLYFLAWEAEKAARRMPQIMLPSWQIRYYMNHAPKLKLAPDADVGFLMAPNQREEIRTSDFTYVLVTDSKGFPNKDPWPTRPDIVFLGDSLIVGEGVGLTGSFPQLIAARLPNQKVVNLGLAGAGPERQHATYRRFGAGLQPRWVVSCLYLASDFDNDLRFSSWLRNGKNIDYNSYRLGFRQAHDTRWTFHPGRLFERSRLLGMGREIVLRWIAGETRLPDRHSFPDGTEVLLYRPTIEFAAEAVAAGDTRIEAMLDALQRLRDFVARNQAELLVMLIPSKEELFGVSASISAHNIVSQLREGLEKAKFSVLDLYPAILKGGVSRSPYFRRDIHLNEYGNRIVAEQFVAWFHTHTREAQLKK
jgi:hypothetical protein